MPVFFIFIAQRKTRMKIRKERIYSAPFALFEKEPEGKGYLLEEREYDGLGHLIKMTRYFEDGNLDERAEYEYDEKGRLVEERVRYALSDSSDKRCFIYDDEKNLETEIYYYGDEEGEKTLTLKNEEGDILEIRRLDDMGMLINREVFEYFAPGKKSYEAEFTGEGVKLKEVITRYDENGKEISQEVWSAEEVEINQRVEIVHEAQKEVAKAFDQEGELLYTRIRVFDEKGNLTEFIHTDANEGGQTIQTVEYDDEEHPLLVEWRSGSGNLMRKQKSEYNESGHLVKEFYFDLNPLTGQQTHQITLHEYEYFEE